MLKIIPLLLLLVEIHGHHNKLLNDADAQSELMPQELNPEFVSDKDSPWRAILPLRQKRSTTELTQSDTTIAQVKRYSRIIASIVLAISAIIEVTVYFIETYSNN